MHVFQAVDEQLFGVDVEAALLHNLDVFVDFLIVKLLLVSIDGLLSEADVELVVSVDLIDDVDHILVELLFRSLSEIHFQNLSTRLRILLGYFVLVSVIADEAGNVEH